jgi:hypothetical protein
MLTLILEKSRSLFCRVLSPGRDLLTWQTWEMVPVQCDFWRDGRAEMGVGRTLIRVPEIVSHKVLISTLRLAPVSVVSNDLINEDLDILLLKTQISAFLCWLAICMPNSCQSDPAFQS